MAMQQVSENRLKDPVERLPTPRDSHKHNARENDYVGRCVCVV